MMLHLSCHLVFFSACLGCVNTERWIGDSYYIPLADQARLATQLVARGVGPDRILQLNGDWFQVPTDYVLQWIWSDLRRSGAPLPPARRCAVADDSYLRHGQETRLRFMEENSDFAVGPVRVAIFDSEREGEKFAAEFFAIPQESPE